MDVSVPPIREEEPVNEVENIEEDDSDSSLTLKR